MTVQDFLFLLFVGWVGGIVNAVAGGAKLAVFPLLMAYGLPPIVANATGTVALWPAQLPAAWVQRHLLAGVFGVVLRRLLPALAGALVGALILIFMDESQFLGVLPLLLLLAIIGILFGSRLSALLVRTVSDANRRGLTFGAMFLTGVYGGFFGAGLGFYLIAVLTISGVRSIHHANAEKNVSAALINTTSIVPFFIAGIVDFNAAVGVLVGGLLGGFTGGHLLRILPERMMRYVVIGLGLALTGYYTSGVRL